MPATHAALDRLVRREFGGNLMRQSGRCIGWPCHAPNLVMWGAGLHESPGHHGSPARCLPAGRGVLCGSIHAGEVMCGAPWTMVSCHAEP
jgi:hypothetical protein